MQVRDLTLGYGPTPVVRNVDLEAAAGTLTAVVGPNGSGKSTLLRGMARQLRPRTGAIALDGRNIADLSGNALARLLGLLPQAPITPHGLSVGDLVSRGRYPHRSWYRRWSTDDEASVHRALAKVELADRVHDPVSQLSGGQRQRAWLAMVLAQDTRYLLLDEPTTYLDLAHAVDVMALARSVARDAGRTVVCVMHDLTLAARFADYIAVMSQGQLVAVGDPREVFTEDLLSDVFGLRARVLDVDGSPAVIPATRP
jgi:iron complex transport system ATP-binding protein